MYFYKPGENFEKTSGNPVSFAFYFHCQPVKFKTEQFFFKSLKTINKSLSSKTTCSKTITVRKNKRQASQPLMFQPTGPAEDAGRDGGERAREELAEDAGGDGGHRHLQHPLHRFRRLQRPRQVHIEAGQRESSFFTFFACLLKLN